MTQKRIEYKLLPVFAFANSSQAYYLPQAINLYLIVFTSATHVIRGKNYHT